MAFDPVTAIFEVGKIAIEKIWPDPVKQAEAQLKLGQLAQAGDLAELDAHVKSLVGQLEINKIEANHKSIFVAGWRPFIGWSCGFALAYASILEPLMRFIAYTSGFEGTFPIIDTTITMQVLMGMLGFGAFRTHEKVKGVNRNNLNH